MPRLHVDQAQHKGGQGEGAQAQRGRVRHLALLDRTVEARLELSPEGGQETGVGSVHMGQRTVAKARGRLRGLMLLLGHFAVDAGVGTRGRRAVLFILADAMVDVGVQVGRHGGVGDGLLLMEGQCLCDGCDRLRPS